MALSAEKYSAYTGLLKDELRVAMGCTEPIALAYAAAYARKVLGRMPQRYEVACSGNIIKNVKAVTVPKTGGLRGIEAAVLAGAVSGRSDLELEVLNVLEDGDRAWLKEELGKDTVTVNLLKSKHPLHIVLDAFAGEDRATVEIINSHTHLGTVKLNGKILNRLKGEESAHVSGKQHSLSVKEILEYADTVNLDDVRETLERQIEYNKAISREGLSSDWGECVGKTVESADPNGLYTQLKAAAAAGSDARMNGCALPVVINSGSGNQGITVSIPVIKYAEAKGCSQDQLLRALCVSNLLALHQKSSIGRLSAFCGAVCAATGSACGIAYLDGQPYQCIADTLTNSVANAGGIVCDGAKSSCAAKIVTSMDSALLGYEMAKRGHVFRSGEGIVKDDVEETILSVGRVAAKGMASTDVEILHDMLGC